MRLRLYCIGSDRESHIGSLWGIFEERRAGHKFLRSKGHERRFGTPVLLEFSVRVTRSPVRVGGLLRSHPGHRYGFEFVDLSPDQHEVISKTCRTGPAAVGLSALNDAERLLARLAFFTPAFLLADTHVSAGRF